MVRQRNIDGIGNLCLGNAHQPNAARGVSGLSGCRLRMMKGNTLQVRWTRHRSGSDACQVDRVYGVPAPLGVS
jgi:hypothetical protein